MQEFINRVRIALVAAICVWSMSSCVYDDDMPPEPAGDGGTLVSLSLKLPPNRAAGDAAGGDNGYLPGEDYENYVDLSNDGSRIYFFDADGKFLTRFIPMFTEPGGTDGTTYTAVGRMPAELEDVTDFSVVVLSNWPAYNDAALVAGTSTVDDLCNDATACFNLLSSFVLDPDKDLTIPFFGIRKYTGVTIAKGKRNDFPGSVALLRAMAKIELVVDISGVSLVDPGLRGYNSRGFCAPAGVHSQADYDHNGVWADDYVKTAHLVGGANDAGQDEPTHILPLLRKREADATHRETWIAYVPEYRNTGAGDYKSHLEFRLDIMPDKLFRLDFAEYETDAATGVTVMKPDSYYDILRNNWYRFTVSLNKGALIINVKKWTAAFDNYFQFK